MNITIINLIRVILNMISDPQIAEITRDVLGMLPSYWWTAPASSSGKYHPTFPLGEGGLVRHSVVVAWFAARLADSRNLNQHEKDIVIAAALLHDGLKQGWGEGAHTVHEHPVLMANFLREFNDPRCDEMADIISSHMGKWTTSKYSSVVLPEPSSKLQLLLQAADMMAATKEIDFDFERLLG